MNQPLIEGWCAMMQSCAVRPNLCVRDRVAAVVA